MPLFETLAAFAVTRPTAAGTPGVSASAQSSSGIVTDRFISCFGLWERTGNVKTSYKNPEKRVGPQVECEWIKGGCLGMGTKETMWTTSKDTNYSNVGYFFLICLKHNLI